MSIDSTVIAFRQPDAIYDPLTELAREGARRMLAQVLIAEADAFVAMWKDVKLADDGPVPSAHQPAAASQRSLQPYASSLPSILSSIRKTYFREDHFKGGRSGGC